MTNVQTLTGAFGHAALALKIVTQREREVSVSIHNVEDIATLHDAFTHLSIHPEQHLARFVR